ncbi:alpha/beta hydrolase [Sphingomonas endolithica]|uniref:alpha/beta hydrolase n=1 Tax=Sphingomonas endolithica TaxID=2972485 RepID=UPI0021AE8EC9|nr:alpha/beta hydrolase [Sphingomonas sp. ZFBP2030]
MKFVSSAMLGASLATLLTPMVCAAQSLPTRSIPAHDLPVPTTASPAMQKVISLSGPSKAPASVPTTNEGWNKRSNPNPAKKHQTVEMLLARYKLAMREETIAGVHCYVLTPTDAPKTNHGRVLVHFHGGGYTSGAGEAAVGEAIFVAGATRMKTIAVDYRMAPDFPYPVPVDDAIAVWKAVSAKMPANKLGMFGTSAGGSLVLSAVQRAITERLPVPGAIMAGTPWSDLSETGDSYFLNRYVDPMVYQDGLSISAAQYAHGIDLKDPRVSPIYGSFTGFPPTLLLTGTRDLFLSNTIRVDRKLRDAGRHSELIVYEGLSHGRYIAGPDFEETKTALKDIATFFNSNLAK